MSQEMKSKILFSPGLAFKGSVERSLLPSTIFLIFYTKTGLESLSITSVRCFSLKCQRKDSKKSERTLPVSWRLWTLAYSRHRPYNFSCPSAMSKNCPSLPFFLGFGCHLVTKSFLWPAMSISNPKQEFEQRKRMKLYDDFWVRAYRFDIDPGRRARARSM